MKFYFIVIFLFLLISCSRSRVESKLVEDTSHKIQVPLQEFGNIDLIDSARYVFLDTDYLIGKIGRVLFYNNDIYIHDEMTARIVVFSKEGKYLFQIDKNGKGPMEYFKLTDFTIDRANGILIIYDSYSHKLLNYSVSKRKFVSEQKIDFYPIALAWKSDHLFFYNPYTINYLQNDKYHFSLITMPQDLRNEKKYFRIDEKMGTFMSNPNGRGFFYGNELYLLNRFDNIIYSLNIDSISAHSEIIFKDNSDYEFALEDAILKGTRNTERYKRCARDITDYCENENFITFCYSRDNKRYFVIYSKKNNNIVFHKWSSPVTSVLLLTRNIPIFTFPSYASDNSFVSILSFEKMNQLLRSDELQKSWEDNMTNKALLKKLKAVNENSNPILVFYKFKS